MVVVVSVWMDVCECLCNCACVCVCVCVNLCVRVSTSVSACLLSTHTRAHLCMHAPYTGINDLRQVTHLELESLGVSDVHSS